MPLTPGSDQDTISNNISEFHQGTVYAKTKRRYGKKIADKQAVAASLSMAQKSDKPRQSTGFKGTSIKGNTFKGLGNSSSKGSMFKGSVFGGK